LGAVAIVETVIIVTGLPRWASVATIAIATMGVAAKRQWATVPRTVGMGILAVLLTLAGMTGYDNVATNDLSVIRFRVPSTFGTWRPAVGETRLRTVIRGNFAWTLTEDGRLVHTDLSKQIKLTPVRVHRKLEGDASLRSTPRSAD
jgi:hypothetical protein